MKRFSEQLHKQAETVKLQVAEKRELRERLISYMEYHPLPANLKAASVAKKSTSREQLLTEPVLAIPVPFFKIFKYSAVAASLLLILVPFVAEKAVPGDTLYAVKVQFNEELRSTLTFDSYQKVEWETERVNRRIAEARLLANEGRLTEAIEADVAEAVKTHTENAQREIDALRTQDADAAAIASIALDTTLEVQSNSLREGESSETEEGIVTTDASHPTGLIASVIDQSRSESEAKNASSTVPAYDKLMARVEQNTTRMYELRDSLEGTIEPTELAEVTRRIEDIERSVQEAITLVGSDELQARKNLVGVLQRTQKLIVFMTELDVTNSADIEKLVPVVLTDQEKTAAIEQTTSELNKKLGQIQAVLPTMKNDDIKTKVQFATTKIKELSTAMTNATEFESFEKVAEEAMALADDTFILLEQNKYTVKQDQDNEENIEMGETGSSTASSSEPIEPGEHTASTTPGVSSTTKETYPELGADAVIDN